MGQACCRPVTKDDDLSPPKRAKNLAQIGTDNSSECFPGSEASHRYQNGLVLDSDDEEFWDAASVASSMYSSCSHLSMSELLDSFQDELHGDIHDFDAEAATARRTGGHLVSAEIEAAARLGTTLETPREGMAVLEEAKARLEAAQLAEIYAKTAGSEALEAIDEQLELQLSLDESVLADLKQAHALQAQGRVLDAHDILLSLCERCGIDLSSLASYSSSKLDFDIKILEHDVHAAHAALAGLDDDTGWMVSREGSLRVHYRHKKGTTNHSLKFHAVFPHQVGRILALAREWDLIPTWNKFSIEALKLAEPSIFESFVYGAQWMMPPFKHMQAIVRARGYDLAESHRCLLILITDVHDLSNLPPGHAPLPKLMSKRRRVNILPGSCIKLRPLPPGPDGIVRTDAHMMVHLDPHIPYVPGSLVNFVLGILAPYVYNQMNKVLKNRFADPDGEFPRRVRDQPELYGLVEERMAEFASELQAEQQSY